MSSDERLSLIKGVFKGVLKGVFSSLTLSMQPYSSTAT